MDMSLFRRLRSYSGLGGGATAIAFAVASANSLAAPKIEEVQPWPTVEPEYLIVWGTGFGGDPKIMFGTSPDPLVRNPGQEAILCPAPNGSEAPPLSTTDKDCLVVDLPIVPNGTDNVPAGDYLLSIWVTGIAQCAEKPSSLTFEYIPADCSGVNLQDATCTGDMTGTDTTDIATEGSNKATWSVSPNPAASGQFITFGPGDNSKWANTLTIDLSDQSSDNTQQIQLHTSCSEPLAIDDVFGSLVLRDMDAETMPTMQHDLYDLTIGAVGPEGPDGPQGKEGPAGKDGEDGTDGDEGPQGKIGETGEQGAQGKIGESGEQGAQGKIGESGEQGAQGKIGVTGEQGAQGKIGVTGEQGPQGKLGETGTQGPQGKLGSTGDQGPQGKLGSTGDQGPQGKAGRR